MSPVLVRAVAEELRERLQNHSEPRRAPVASPPRPPRVSRAHVRVSLAAILLGALLIGALAYTPRVASGIADFFVQTIADDSGTAPADPPRQRLEGR